MKEEMSVKTIIAIGTGSAVFIILSRFVVIPTGTPSTSLEMSYPFLVLVPTVFGPMAGGLIGLIGHTLKDFIIYGSTWWSWAICSGIIGIIFGSAGRKMSLQHGEFTTNDMIRFNIFQTFGSIVVWGLTALSLGILIYSEPAGKMFTQDVFMTVPSIVAARITGTLLMKAYASTRAKKGSLSKG